jgi:hypothetical protein
MKEISARLALGPMSTEAIEAIYRYSDDHDIQLMLIASKAQIDHDGGYVNNWTTEQFVEHVNKLKKNFTDADVLLCRDHCGPGFKKSTNVVDHYITAVADIDAGFDLIHVDFCHLQSNHKGKLEASKQLIEHIQKINPQMMFEIGTDENVGAAEMNLDRIENDIDFFLSFCDPKFYVVQTGSLIKEINQVGSYDEPSVELISDLLHSRDLKLKEHNADYLSFNDLKRRRKAVDAVNIAPMLGVIQTNFVLHRCMLHGFDTTPFLNKAYDSGRWSKWLYNNTADNKYLCALTAGHYVFTSDEYRSLIDRLNKVDGDIYESIVDEHYDVINNYMIGLGEI